ncbi:MAG: hypothetical protein B7X04_00605 [Parcubacteria group bacterium 21-54-25]|nr:MAG: hypothetical protein B7X04_00605 [Parcubacteria group bacterium 21-54-25]HQU07445.1 FkbM family methyltransferase [Candidatus Paceibacterota bacterium]
MKGKNILKPRMYVAYARYAYIQLRKIHRDAKMSFSQEGEDLLIALAFRFMKVPMPTYLDIGAHHPTRLSNTYLFYRRGSHGVCIEANPTLAKNFKKKRSRDTVLPIAIGTQMGETTLHIVSDSSLSTTSEKQAQYFDSVSKHKIIRNVKVPQKTIMDIIRTYFPIPPNLVSLDIENMDFAVLKTFDFSTCRPSLFCIETLTYDEQDGQEKLYTIIDYMKQKNYFVFADTYVNTIFIDKEQWPHHVPGKV